MEGRLRANMLWDSIVRYKTERGALGSKTGYPRLPLSQKESLSIKHAAPLQDAGVTARRPLDFTASRPVCRLTRVLKGSGQKEVSCAGLRGPARAARAALGGVTRMGLVRVPPPREASSQLYENQCPAMYSCGVMGTFWGLWAGVHVSGGRSSSMSGGAAGGDSHGRVHVVGNVPACVPGGGNAELADLQIGVDAAGRLVVLIKQLVQCARDVRASAANTALATGGASLARRLGHGDALQTATWGKGSQCTCDVKHVETVFDWAVEGHGGINVMVQEQRDELVAAVHKVACDLAATRLTRARDAMADSIGVDIAGVDAEVNRLLTDLHSAKAQAEDVITQLQHMHTELSGVREEARSELAEEARWRTQLQQDLVDLKAELQVAQQEPAHMHSPGPLLEVEGDASMNETRDQVI